MRKLYRLVHSLLLVTTPSLLVYPQDHYLIQQIYSHEKMYDGFNLTYDDILDLLQDIEAEVIEDFSEEQSNKISHFITFLARQGTLHGDYAALARLQNDTATLFGDQSNFFDYTYASPCINTSTIFPTLVNNAEDAMIFLCKYKKDKQKKKKEKKNKKQKSKQHHHQSSFTRIKNFIKKHKKAIIIGAIVVIATAVVIVAIAGTVSSAGAAAAAAAAAGTATNGNNKNEPKEQGQEQDLLSSPISDSLSFVNQIPELESAIETHTSNFKETVTKKDLLHISNQSHEDEDIALEEKARNLGAILAHQALDGVAELLSFAPHLLEEIKDVGQQIFPECFIDLQDEFEITPVKNFENLMAIGHEKIDVVFSTEQASFYTPEAKDAKNKFAIGIIPFPGIFSEGILNANKLTDAGKVTDRAGFTRAGRSLMKHGYRESSVFPKPVGTPAQVNEHGQKILEKILNHPEKKLIPREVERFGKVVDIYAPDIGGARYTSEGEFIGFLEP